MRERSDEFEELLERTLRGRVNGTAPAEMVERIAAAAGREPVVSRREVGVWQMAVAAGVLLAVTGSLYGWRYERRVERAAAPPVAREELSSGRPGAMKSTAPIVAAARTRVEGGVRRRAKASDGLVAREEGPKLDMFPSTALYPPKPAPGSMEAQLQVLISLPESTLAQMAEDQAKQERVRTETQDKLN